MLNLQVFQPRKLSGGVHFSLDYFVHLTAKHPIHMGVFRPVKISVGHE